MAIGNAGLAARLEEKIGTTIQLRRFLSRYVYFCMSLVFAGLVVWGFSKTVDASLFHAKPPRTLLLWMHGAAFSTWIVFFIAQSALALSTSSASIERLPGSGPGLPR